MDWWKKSKIVNLSYRFAPNRTRNQTHLLSIITVSIFVLFSTLFIEQFDKLEEIKSNEYSDEKFKKNASLNSKFVAKSYWMGLTSHFESIHRKNMKLPTRKVINITDPE